VKPAEGTEKEEKGVELVKIVQRKMLTSGGFNGPGRCARLGKRATVEGPAALFKGALIVFSKRRTGCKPPAARKQK